MLPITAVLGSIRMRRTSTRAVAFTRSNRGSSSTSRVTGRSGLGAMLYAPVRRSRRVWQNSVTPVVLRGPQV